MRYFSFFIFSFLLIIFSFQINPDNNIDKTNNIDHQENANINQQSIISTDNKTSITSDNSTLNQTEIKSSPKKKRGKKRSKVKFSTIIPNNTNNISNDVIYSLSDVTFDLVLQNGKNYKWFVLLYSDTCGHCAYARKEIKKIFPDYKNSTIIRFAEIEVNRNQITFLRFSTDGVPYIFMLYNNKMYEFDLYPHSKNLKKFIDTKFEDVEDELKPFPPMVSTYRYGWEVIKKAFSEFVNSVNDFISDSGYDIKFTPISLIMIIALIIILFLLLQCYCTSKFCPDEEYEEVKKEVKVRKKIEEEINKIEKNGKNEKKEGKKETENVKNDGRESKNEDNNDEEEKIEKENKREMEKMKEQMEKEEKIMKESPKQKEKAKKKKKKE